MKLKYEKYSETEYDSIVNVHEKSEFYYNICIDIKEF
jgi:hypothetical protein